MRLLTLVFPLVLSIMILPGCTGSDSKTDTGSSNTEPGNDTGEVVEDGNTPLVGLGFNSSAGTHELRSINPETAEVTAVTGVDFGADGFESWFGVMTDSDAGVMYAVSGSGALLSVALDGSSVETVGTLSQSMQAMDVGNGELIGIGYDDARGLNILRSVNVSTAEVTELTTFAFDSGAWQAYVVNDPDAGVLYAVSTNNTLYRIQMDGSAVQAIGQLSQGIQHMGLGVDGLIGVGYNDYSGLNELRSINTDTAEVTTLTSFAFDTGYWDPWVITDPSAGVLYVRSTGNTMYRLQIDGSGVETMGALSDGILPYAMALGTN